MRTSSERNRGGELNTQKQHDMRATYHVTVINLKSGHKMSYNSQEREDATRFAAYYRRKNQAKKYKVELNKINL